MLNTVPPERSDSFGLLQKSHESQIYPTGVAARDHLEDFWKHVQDECMSNGIQVGSPLRGTELSIRATTGVGWTIHHRSDHIRAGLILRPTTQSSPTVLIAKLRPAINRVEERVGRKMVVEQKNTVSRKARIYLAIDSFEGENFATWDSSISQAVYEWSIIMDEFGTYLSALR